MKKPVLMGASKFYQGDCIELMEELPAECFDLCVTDPPYLIEYKTNMRQKTADNELLTEEIEGDNDPDLIRRFFPRLYRVLKNNTAAYIFCRIDNHEFFLEQAVKSGFVYKGTIIWAKDKQTGGDLTGEYGRKYECILFFHKGRVELREKRHSDVWQFATVPSRQMVHPNQKPLALLARPIKDASDPGDVVFDPFSGSGGVAIVCEQSGRRSVNVELGSRRFDVLIKRFSVESTSLF
jgi:site-specific DNA-methyltransferase (adenine-specific)